MAQGANVALSGAKVVACLPAVSASIGQWVGKAAAQNLGVTNHHVENLMELGGAIAFGATAGAALGGGALSVPAAAGGAAMAVVVVTTSKFVDALVTSKFGFAGPSDNWAYMETGNCGKHKVCYGTYGLDDTWYIHTYWKEYKGSNNKWIMSAG